MESQSFSNNVTPKFQEQFIRPNEAFVEPPQDNMLIFIYIAAFVLVTVLVAHYAGFNIFEYLGKATDATGNIILPFWENVIGFFTNIMGKVGEGSVAESQELGKAAAKSVKKSAEVVEDNLDEFDEDDDGNIDLDEDVEEEVYYNDPESSVNGGKKTKNRETPLTKASDIEKNLDDDLDKLIEKETLKKSIEKPNKKTEKDREKLDNVQPNDQFSNTQRAKPGNNKSGWCYIGNYSGYRSCSKVGEADKCMSGDIFPTHDVCVNPSLRA